MDLTGGKEAEEGIDLERTDLAEREAIQVAAAGVVVGQVEAEVQEGGGGILHHIQADPHQGRLLIYYFFFCCFMVG